MWCSPFSVGLLGVFSVILFGCSFSLGLNLVVENGTTQSGDPIAVIYCISMAAALTSIVFSIIVICKLFVYCVISSFLSFFDAARIALLSSGPGTSSVIKFFFASVS